jgi:phage terminase large subunit-like protein
MANNQVILQCRRAMADVDTFIETCSTIKLRDYQRGVAEAVFQSVREHAGRSFVVMFPRQSGKNELQAQLETYLLCCYYLMNAEMVKVSPTWKPQTLNAMRRLRAARVTIAGTLLPQRIRATSTAAREAAFIFSPGSRAPTSWEPQANVLLEVDEAQDSSPAKFDKI